MPEIVERPRNEQHSTTERPNVDIVDLLKQRADNFMPSAITSPQDQQARDMLNGLTLVDEKADAKNRVEQCRSEMRPGPEYSMLRCLTESANSRPERQESRQVPNPSRTGTP